MCSTGTPTLPGGKAEIQVGVGAPGSVTCFSLKLYDSASEVDPLGPDGNAICMTIMPVQLEGGSPLTDVFFCDEQARRLMLWLAHHELDPTATVQAFLAARTLGATIIHRT